MAGERSLIVEELPEGLIDPEEKIRVVIVDGERVISDYEIATELNDPFDFDPSSFMPNTTPMSLPLFFEIASKLIAKAQETAGIVSGKRAQLTEEYPPEPFESFGDEVIAYRVLRREPANMSVKGTSRPQRKSMYDYDFVSAQYPNKVIVVESRPIDHRIEFTCWAKSNKLANKRALWLEKLFVNNAWVFETSGVERFYWMDRGPDTYTTTGGNRLFYRPINFFVRYKEFEVKAHSQIKRINFEVST